MSLTDPVMDSETEPAAAASRRRRRLPRGLLALGAASAALLIAGVLLLVLGSGLQSSSAKVNGALYDAQMTRSVLSAVTTDIAQIYSYSYTDLATSQAQARRVLTGQAAAQYRELSPLLNNAVSEHLTLTTKVVTAGVSYLSGGTARLLVFMNQTATKPGAKPASSVAQLAVTARRSGGQWLITSIEAR